jgi:MarR family transcriptional regulator, temperature-dependent positive regulator of motility
MQPILDLELISHYCDYMNSDGTVKREPFLAEYLFGPGDAATGTRALPIDPATAIPGRRAPVYLANQFAQVIRGLMAEALEPYGLTQQQWGVMVAIAREPGTDQRRVAERRNIDVNSASRLIDELEVLKLVRRVPSPTDRRANQLLLTRAGARLQKMVQGPAIAAQDRALACLNRREKTLLCELLTRVVEANQAYARPGVGRRKPVRKASEEESSSLA